MFCSTLTTWICRAHFLLLLALATWASPAFAELILVKDGEARCAIVLPAQPSEREHLAAQELAHFLNKMSGAQIPIVEGEAPQALTRILLGAAAAEVIGQDKLNEALGPNDDGLSCRDGFVIVTKPSVLAIRGVRDTGTLFGVYEVLEQLGCRWYWPGAMGEVVPKHETVRLRDLNVVQTPSFDKRSMWFSWGSSGENGDAREACEAWNNHARLGGTEHSSGHAEHHLLTDPDHVDFKVNQLLKELGESTPSTAENPRWVSMSWDDSNARIPEEQALGLRHPWEHDIEVSTDALMAYYNAVIARVEPQHPHVWYGFLVYENYFLPPLMHMPNARLSPMIAPIQQCTRHLPGSGECWERDYLFRIIESWGRICPKRVFIYDYEPGFIDVSDNLPMPALTRQKVEMPLLHKLGVRGILQQSCLSVMNQGPNLWVRAKQMWDADADVEALLKDYYKNLYGDAGGPIREYWDALEQMMHHGPGHQRKILKAVYPIEKVRPLERFIKEAEAEAENEDEMVRQRVHVIRLGYDNLMMYLRMREAEDEGRYADAAALAEQQLHLHKHVETIDPVLFQIGDMDRGDENHWFLTGGWVQQNKIRQALIDGTKGDLVTLLPEVWQFRLDPKDEGVVYEWFDPATDTKKWDKARTTRTWSTQGFEPQLDRHHNIGWYRTSVDTPPQFADRKINLNIFNPGNTRGTMHVWVNGEFAAYEAFDLHWWSGREAELLPRILYSLDITNHLRRGEKNTIVIRLDCDISWDGFDHRLLLWSPK